MKSLDIKTILHDLIWVVAGTVDEMHCCLTPESNDSIRASALALMHRLLGSTTKAHAYVAIDFASVHTMSSILHVFATGIDENTIELSSGTSYLLSSGQKPTREDVDWMSPNEDGPPTMVVAPAEVIASILGIDGEDLEPGQFIIGEQIFENGEALGEVGAAV